MIFLSNTQRHRIYWKKRKREGVFDEDFNIPKETRHEQLSIFAYEFCRKMKNAPFTDNGTNYALFERLFGLKGGTLGKAYRKERT